MSFNQTTIKPIAKKLYAELSATHGNNLPAMLEAMEIARRQAEIDQTKADWSERHGFNLDDAAALLSDAAGVFESLVGELGPQPSVHVLTALEREQTRQRWGADLVAWRKRNELTVTDAAIELGLAFEDVTALERGDFSAGPDAMRQVRKALLRVRGELTDVGNHGSV